MKKLQEIAFECGNRLEEGLNKNPLNIIAESVIMPLSNLDFVVANIVVNGESYDGSRLTNHLRPFAGAYLVAKLSLYPNLYWAFEESLKNLFN